ncbi:MAG: LysM peptidoglycan-binding domain-containing protein, partial [Chloroflexi bacterium]|nr:LysM peptidoglycan-binding domain-containing protein [Chloroflexota bacterium]
SIAEEYGLTIRDIVEMNLLIDPEFNRDFLQVGQQLVIPICGIPTPTPTLEPTATQVPTREIPTPIPTATDPPAGTVTIRVARVLNPGDVTSEAVEIVNVGSPVELEGWTLENSAGDAFVFPDFRLFAGGGVTVYTGVGEDTPVDLYWGRTEPAWAIGDIVFLYNPDRELQAEFEITAE